MTTGRINQVTFEVGAAPFGGEARLTKGHSSLQRREPRPRRFSVVLVRSASRVLFQR